MLIEIEQASECYMEEIDRLEALREELASKVLLLEQINYELSKKNLEAQEVN